MAAKRRRPQAGDEGVLIMITTGHERFGADRGGAGPALVSVAPGHRA
jgi:hypothetical protein